MTELTLTYCPDAACYAPAEVVDDYAAESTCGPVRHRVVLCANRHRYHVIGED